MKIIDSNILIYSYKEEFKFLRTLFQDVEMCLSEVSKIETLGFYKIDAEEQQYYKTLFYGINIIQIDTEIVDKAIDLRQKQKMSIGDAIIAATALIYDLEIVTRNTKDFEKIKGLKATNPLV